MVAYKKNSYLSRFNPATITAIFLSVLLLKLARPGLDFYFYAWVGLVPLLYVIRGVGFVKQFFLVASTFWIFYLSIGDWIIHLAENFMGLPFPLSYLFLILFAGYLSMGNALIVGIAWFIKNNLKYPYFVVLPLCYAALWPLFPQLFQHGFAETQVPALIMLQAIDITGANGINFIIVLINCLVLALLTKEYKLYPKSFSLSIIILLVWVGYGFYWQDKYGTEDLRKLKIGLAQPNRPAKLNYTGAEPGYSIMQPWELVESVKLAQAGAKVVLWPEGNFYFFNHNKQVFENFSRTAKDHNINLLFGESKEYPGIKKVYNSILWLKEDGSLGEEYKKNILVPFGEYLPGGAIVGGLLKYFGFYIPNYSPGDKNYHFKLQNAALIPAICYESLFGPYIAQQYALGEAEKFIFVISQDGWYDSYSQTTGHSYVTALRAVENRAPVLHLIQNGFSSLTYPNGKLVKITDYKRRQAGIVEVPLAPPNQLSFFTRFPYFVTMLFSMLFSILLFAAVSKKLQE